MTNFTPIECSDDVTVYAINNDTYGNPRYVVHYLSLCLDSYETTALLKRRGLSKYRGKQFGGGFVFSVYGVEDFVNNLIQEIKEEY